MTAKSATAMPSSASSSSYRRRIRMLAVSVLLGQLISLLDTFSSLFVKLLSLQTDCRFPILQYVFTYAGICMVAAVPFFRHVWSHKTTEFHAADQEEQESVDSSTLEMRPLRSASEFMASSSLSVAAAAALTNGDALHRSHQEQPPPPVVGPFALQHRSDRSSSNRRLLLQQHTIACCRDHTGEDDNATNMMQPDELPHNTQIQEKNDRPNNQPATNTHSPLPWCSTPFIADDMKIHDQMDDVTVVNLQQSDDVLGGHQTCIVSSPGSTGYHYGSMRPWVIPGSSDRRRYPETQAPHGDSSAAYGDAGWHALRPCLSAGRLPSYDDSDACNIAKTVEHHHEPTIQADHVPFATRALRTPEQTSRFDVVTRESPYLWPPTALSAPVPSERPSWQISSYASSSFSPPPLKRSPCSNSSRSPPRKRSPRPADSGGSTSCCGNTGTSPSSSVPSGSNSTTSSHHDVDIRIPQQLAPPPHVTVASLPYYHSLQQQQSDCVLPPQGLSIPKRYLVGFSSWWRDTQQLFTPGTYGFYFLLAFLDVQGGTLSVVAFNHANLASSCLIDWVSLLTAFALSVKFMREKVTRYRILALLLGLAGSLCILVSDGLVQHQTATAAAATPGTVTAFIPRNLLAPGPEWLLPEGHTVPKWLPEGLSVPEWLAEGPPEWLLPEGHAVPQQPSSHQHTSFHAKDLIHTPTAAVEPDQETPSAPNRHRLLQDNSQDAEVLLHAATAAAVPPRVAPNQLFGDVMCVVAAVFLGIVTVMLEKLLSIGIPISEVLMKTFAIAFIIAVAEFIVLELKDVHRLNNLSLLAWIYFICAGLSMTAVYCLAPFVLERSSSAFFNLSLLTSAGLSVLLSASVLGDPFPALYSVGLAIIFGSLVIYYREKP